MDCFMKNKYDYSPHTYKIIGAIYIAITISYLDYVVGYSVWGAMFILIIASLSALVTAALTQMTDGPFKKRSSWIPYAVVVFMSWVLPVLVKPAVNWVFDTNGK